MTCPLMYLACLAIALYDSLPTADLITKIGPSLELPMTQYTYTHFTNNIAAQINQLRYYLSAHDHSPRDKKIEIEKTGNSHWWYWGLSAVLYLD